MDNITYMKQWFLKHNRFLAEDAQKNEILDILVVYGIIFEKLDDVNDEDAVFVKDGVITCTAGPAKQSDRIDYLLNVVNARYGYLSYEDLIDTTIYEMLISSEDEDGLTDEYPVDFCERMFDNVLEEFRNYDFDRIVYRVNGKVFFCDDELSEREMKRLDAYKNDSQKLYEVNRSDDGSLMIW